MPIKRKCPEGFLLRDQDLPLRDRTQGWKHEGQGAPRGRGASCCVSHFQLILSGRSTCLTLSGAPSPWRHDPDKFSDRLPSSPGRSKVILSTSNPFSQFYALPREAVEIKFVNKTSLNFNNSFNKLAVNQSSIKNISTRAKTFF